MQIETLKFLMASDSEVGAAALVNGVAIATVNRDEHGSAGEQVLRSVLEGLSKLSSSPIRTALRSASLRRWAVRWTASSV